MPAQLQKALARNRADQASKNWQDDYLRAGAEGIIHQIITITDIHHARYCGLANTHLQHALSAIALNLARIDPWWNGQPFDCPSTESGQATSPDSATHSPPERVRQQGQPANLPSKFWSFNRGWALAANIAADLSARIRLLGLHDRPDLALLEPGTLRYRMLHLPAIKIRFR